MTDEKQLPAVEYQDHTQTWGLSLSMAQTSWSLDQYSNQRQSQLKGIWWFWSLSPTILWTLLGDQRAKKKNNKYSTLFINVLKMWIGMSQEHLKCLTVK